MVTEYLYLETGLLQQNSRNTSYYPHHQIHLWESLDWGGKTHIDHEDVGWRIRHWIHQCSCHHRTTTACFPNLAPQSSQHQALFQTEPKPDRKKMMHKMLLLCPRWSLPSLASHQRLPLVVYIKANTAPLSLRQLQGHPLWLLFWWSLPFWDEECLVQTPALHPSLRRSFSTPEGSSPQLYHTELLLWSWLVPFANSFECSR